MGLGKNGYYSVKDVKTKNCQYNIILGERSPGKSYAVKTEALTNAFKSGTASMVLLRRYEDDIKNVYMQRYFNDINEGPETADGSPVKITKGQYNYIHVVRGNIYFSIRDKESGSIADRQLAGFCMALNLDERYKSQQFPQITDIIYEEFITNKIYLRDEPDRLQHLVSTITRDRNCSVWMIGNTLSRVSPYFQQWSLRNVPRMSPGSIDLYTVDDTQIAVEMCPSRGVRTKMFFGNAAKSISGGQWDSSVYPGLQRPYNEYDVIYEMYVEAADFMFKMELLIDERANMLVFVYPYYNSPKPDIPWLTDKYYEDWTRRRHLDRSIKPESTIAALAAAQKVCFSSNLTGSDFYQALRSCNMNLMCR